MRRNRTALSLVIPTRNEAENVERLIWSICRSIPGPEKELVFVDDSDDDTPATLQKLLAQADCPGLVLLRANAHREGGLSTAVCHGFATSSGAYICTMDADLQHPASAIPLLLDTAQATGADIVVGSRYVGGGGGAQGFDGAGRQMVSMSARMVARAALPCARVTSDPLSGFFLLRRSVVEGINLRPVGYKILLEILVRGRWRSLVDTSYAFHSRNAGVSKATMVEGMQFARHMALLLPQAWSRHRTRASRPVSRPMPAIRVNGRNGHSNGHHEDDDESVIIPPEWQRVPANGTDARRTSESGRGVHAR